MIYESLHFRHSWRSYQKLVLDQAQKFLDDKHINVVAPPGSGKTILGIELLRRVGQPTIVLAPTITIRNQWASRLVENFTESELYPEWLSTDIKNPKQITIATYQGLFSILKEEALEEEIDFEKEEEEADPIPELPSDLLVIPDGEQEEELIAESSEATNRVPTGKKAKEFLDLLNQLGVRTIVVDEAHHLRNEWWKSLSMLRDNLAEPVIIALTATPPYDVLESEWKRYEEFCGVIDCEVPIPDLIKNNVICPHQDFLYFSELTESEKATARKVKENIDDFIEDLLNNSELFSAMAKHPCVIDPMNSQEEIFEFPRYYSSICAYFKRIGNPELVEKIEFLLTGGKKSSEENLFERKSLEIFLEKVLFRDPYFQKEEHKSMVKEIHKACVRAGVVDHREIAISNPKLLSKLLAQSQSKIFAVESIIEHELSSLGDEFRCVVLTDFIRKEYLPSAKKTDYERIGVIPIFEHLRKSLAPAILEKTCVLTGTIVVVHGNMRDQITNEIESRVSSNQSRGKVALSFQIYDAADQFYILHVTDSNRQHIVATMTDLFEQGVLHQVIGTRSLLGEGWDAPSINTLILASDVGSFMMSNQMRGRAIRVSPQSPDKVSNIWHIAALAPEMGLIGPGLAALISYGYEYNSLKTRFKTFVGICKDRLGIESGIERVDTLPSIPMKGDFTFSMREISNRTQFLMAANRQRTRKMWADSIDAGAKGLLVHKTEADPVNIPEFPRSFLFAKSFKILVATILASWSAIFYAVFESAGRSGSLKAALVVFLVASIFPIYKLMRLFILWARGSSPEKNMERMCRAIIFALHESGDIRTNPRMCKVVVNKSFDKTFIGCGTEGLSIAENNIVLDALEEIFSPIDNPRYLLCIKNQLVATTRKDTWFSVPSVFSRKEKVSSFERAVSAEIASAQMIYTRTLEGRQALLAARKYSVINRVFNKEGRRTIWQ